MSFVCSRCAAENAASGADGARVISAMPGLESPIRPIRHGVVRERDAPADAARSRALRRGGVCADVRHYGTGSSASDPGQHGYFGSPVLGIGAERPASASASDASAADLSAAEAWG